MNVILLGILIFFAIVGTALFVMAVGIYNGLVSLKNQVERAWANIDVLLKQRFDEIPNLVSVCEQYVQYERSTFEKLAEARKHYGSASSKGEKISADAELTGALRGILALGEAYPQLRSNENFVQLQTRISSLESAIADRREMVNETAATFNTRLQQFPDTIFANMLGYRPVELFKVQPAETAMPSVKMKIPA